MDGPHQGIHFLFCIIKGPRRPRGGRHSEALHHRHGAVMACADRDPLLIQDRADVMGVNAVKDERQDAGFFFSRSDDPQPLKRREGLSRISEQSLLVSGYRLQPDSTQIVNRRP